MKFNIPKKVLEKMSDKNICAVSNYMLKMENVAPEVTVNIGSCYVWGLKQTPELLEINANKLNVSADGIEYQTHLRDLTVRKGLLGRVSPLAGVRDKMKDLYSTINARPGGYDPICKFSAEKKLKRIAKQQVTVEEFIKKPVKYLERIAKGCLKEFGFIEEESCIKKKALHEAERKKAFVGLVFEEPPQLPPAEK